jgi:8-oxo-dGTP diphosphatase
MMSELPQKHVVTCFIEFQGKILLLQRSQQVGSHKGKWAGVSGYLETSPDEQSLKEIREETALESQDIRLLKKGIILEVDDYQTGVHWIVYPYMYQVYDPVKIRIDWEHCNMQWIIPEEIKIMDTVPMLKEALAQFVSF